MINLLAIVPTTGVALGSFLGGNTRAAQAHTSLDKAGAIFCEVNPVSWSPVNDIFTHAVKPLDAGRITQSHSKFGNGHLGCGLR
jgi:hypothetical protein